MEILKNLNQIKVIYSDVDGTLVNQGCLFKTKGGYSFKNAQSVYKLLKKGIDVVMTSGREKDKLKETARILGFNHYIANLGIEIVYNQGERILTNFGIDVSNGESLKKWIEETGAVQELFNRYPGKVRYYSPWSEILRTHHLLIGELDIIELNSWMSNNYSVLRIIDNGSVPSEKEFSEPHAYHIIPKGVGKKEAVKIDKKERNLAPENLIAIGDSMEDITMADEVGVFFLLDKTVLTRKKNVIYIDNQDGEGFSRIIDILEKRNLI
jgi:HAD superfamily hydrolase (TIGR01484 family)